MGTDDAQRDQYQPEYRHELRQRRYSDKPPVQEGEAGNGASGQRDSEGAESVGDQSREADFFALSMPRRIEGRTKKERWSHWIRRQAKNTAVSAFPPLTWAPRYKRGNLLRDAIGGLVVGTMMIPLGLGYATLAKIPIQIGLYSAAIYAAVYGVFGNVAALGMGPVAEITLILTGANLPSGEEGRAQAVQLISLQVGILTLILSFIKGGVIIRHSFAKAVGDAYAAAAAIIIILVQLVDAFNLKNTKKTVLIHEILREIFTGLAETNINSLYSFLLFAAFTAYLISMKNIERVPSWIPHQMFVLIVGILITWLARLDERIELSITKDIPTTIPSPKIPDTQQFLDVLVSSVVITLVSFLQMYSIAIRVTDQHIGANQEMFANGMCALCAGVLGGMPGSSSFSVSGVCKDIGVRTPLRSILSAVVVLACFLGLVRLGVFYYLPKITLAAIIVSAVYGLVNFSHALWLFRVFKVDFCVWVVVFLLTIFLGVQYGVLSGIGLSIVIVLFRVGRVKSYAMAFNVLDQAWDDANVDDELLVHRDVHVWCFDSPLYFINVSYVSPKLRASIKRANRPISVVVIDCSRMRDIDASSVESLTIQLRNLESELDVVILLAAMFPKVTAALKRDPRDPWKGETFSTVEQAVQRADEIVAHNEHLLAPHRPVPASLYRPRGGTVTNETVSLLAVVSHADRSPKQKLKLDIEGTPLVEVLQTTIVDASHSIVRLEPGDNFREVLLHLRRWHTGDAMQGRIAATIAHIFEHYAQDHWHSDNTVDQHQASTSMKAVVKSGSGGHRVLVVRWGGAITDLGMDQAEACGKALANRFGLDPREEEEPINRVLRVRVTCGEEDRVVITATAFTRAFTQATRAVLPDDFDVDTAIGEPCDAAKAFAEKNMTKLSSALHARTPQETLLAKHVGGVREITEILGGHGKRPVDGLLTVAQLVCQLIVSIRTAARGCPPECPLLLSHGETAENFAHRYALVIAQLVKFNNHNDADESGDEESVNLSRRSSGSQLRGAERPAMSVSTELRRCGPADAETSSRPRTEISSNNDAPEGAGVSRSEELHETHVAHDGGTLSVANLTERLDYDRRRDQDEIALGQAPGRSTSNFAESTYIKDAFIKDVVDFLYSLTDQHVFDIAKITTLYDHATYDALRNAKKLQDSCGFNMRRLVALLQPLFVAVSAGRFGVTPSEKLVASSLSCVALLRRVKASVVQHIGNFLEQKHQHSESVGRNAPFGSPTEDVGANQHPQLPPLGCFWNPDSLSSTMPPRDMAVDLFFTPTVMVTALRLCLALSDKMRRKGGAHAAAVLRREQTGWHYMSYVVLSVTHDPSMAREPAAGSAREGARPPASSVPPPSSTPPNAAATAPVENESDTYRAGNSSTARNDTVPLERSSPRRRNEAEHALYHEFLLDVYLSAGAAFRTEAATNLIQQQQDGHDGINTPGDTQMRKAAEYLAKVSPLLRVWRLSVADFCDIVDEVETVVSEWLS
jgi:SulP family sulfate permease